MIIEGEVRNEDSTAEVTSKWTYNLDDPLAVRVEFLENEVAWVFSVELLAEAFTSPVEKLHGFGDVQIEVGEEHAFLYLTNGRSSATLKFPSQDIREFLNQVDDLGVEEAIARELDDFLETL